MIFIEQLKTVKESSEKKYYETKINVVVFATFLTSYFRGNIDMSYLNYHKSLSLYISTNKNVLCVCKNDEDRFKKELNKSYRFPSPNICIIVQINDVER